MFNSILNFRKGIMSYIFHRFRFIAFFLWLVPSWSQAALNKNNSDQLIVLFHGLANKAASFDSMKKGLEQAFPSASVLALTSVEGVQSLNLSIKEQAEICFQELESKVADIGCKSIILIGHSQGGVRAYAFLKQYEHLLKVKGLIALATPWEGVPGTRVDTEMLSQYLTGPVLRDLQVLSLSLGHPADTLAGQFMVEVQTNQNMCRFPGAKDLKVGSNFLSEVQKMLPYEKTAILSIGGGKSDFRSLIQNKKVKHSFNALNSMYTLFIAGETRLNRSHDMMVPLYSQHALNIVPKGKKNFKRVFIKDVFHSTRVLTILDVPKGSAMLAHPRVLRRVIQFSQNVFAQK